MSIIPYSADARKGQFEKKMKGWKRGGKCVVSLACEESVGTLCEDEIRTDFISLSNLRYGTRLRQTREKSQGLVLVLQPLILVS